MAKIELNFSNKDDFLRKTEIEVALDKLIKNEVDKVKISGITSIDFLEMFGLSEDDADDFNGWQGDWDGYMEYKNTDISILGCAFYGTITLYIEDEEDDKDFWGEDDEEDEN